MINDLNNFIIGHAKEIDRMSGSMLERQIEGLIDLIAEEELEFNEEIFDIKSDYNKRDILESIYNEITSEEDKALFAKLIVENENKLGTIVADSFRNLVMDNNNDYEDATDSDENEIEEEQELNTPDQTFDDTSYDAEEMEEELEEELEEEPVEKNIEGPEITSYKQETALYEMRLKELEDQLASLDNNEPAIEETNKENKNDYKNLIAILKNTIETNNAIRTELNEKYDMNLEIINDEELNKFLAEATKVEKLDKEIDTTTKEIESLNSNIEALKSELEKLKQANKPTNLLNYTLSKFEQEKETAVQKLADLNYKKEIEKKSAVYIDADMLRNICMDQLSSLNNTTYAISTKRNEIKEARDHVPYELQIEEEMDQTLPGKGTYTSRLNVLKNDLFEATKTLDNKNNEINVNPKEEIVEKNNNEELINEINNLKEKIAERKNIEALYYDALNDIRNISNDIKSGKTPADEEIQNKVNAVREKINPLPTEPQNLKGELENELEKALTMTPEEIEKEPSKRNKWIQRIASLGLGMGTGFAIVTLCGLGAAGMYGIMIGSQLLNFGVKALHKKYKNEVPELGEENEITNIEKTGPLSKLKEKFKNLMRNENVVKNISWFLTGTTIGAGLGKAFNSYQDFKSAEVIHGTEELKGISGTQPSTDPYSNIKIGDSAKGLDLSQGYDRANWAANNLNAETLNQTVINDGNSIINSVGVVKDGATHVVDTAGKSLAEIAKQYGVSPEELVMNITNNQGASRAWVDAAEAVGRTL